MTMYQEYEAYRDRQTALSAGPMGKYCLRQERRYVPPFRLYGPVWYVGDNLWSTGAPAAVNSYSAAVSMGGNAKSGTSPIVEVLSPGRGRSSSG